jgi:signal transduction histidine kinase
MAQIMLDDVGSGLQALMAASRSLERAGATQEQSIAADAGEPAGHWRALFMAEAGRLLNSSLDYATTLEAVARAAVPALADYCLVDLLQDDGVVHRLVAVHRDPDKEKLMDRMRRVHHPHLSQPGIVMDVMRTGQPLLHEQMAEEDLVAASHGPEHLELLRALGPRSRVTVPLIARSRTLGSISLVMSDSGRRYAQADVELAMDLAQRAAIAIDNARLYREAQEANAAKDRFLAQLSHELRTPLTPALLLAQSCACREDLPQDIRDDAKIIQRNLELEARLIDDLLDLTRVASGKLKIEAAIVDGHEVAIKACDVCRTEMRAKSLRLAVELSAVRHHVEADPARLQQVLWNLLRNATKFTPSGGSITLRSTNPRPDLLRFEVQDTGTGIESDAMLRIFRPFEQASESVTRQFGGLGLGLAISKALVEMHHGQSRAHSDGAGRGATFTVELRTVECPSADSAVQRGGAVTGNRPLRILLVEDHDDTLHLMTRLLERQGHQVTRAGGIAEALDAAEGGRFDLVISDLGLPDGSGLQLMQHLRRQCDLPGIALSGFGMEEDVRRSLEAGFTAHLTKPLDIEQLHAAIGQVISGTC